MHSVPHGVCRRCCVGGAATIMLWLSQRMCCFGLRSVCLFGQRMRCVGLLCFCLFCLSLRSERLRSVCLLSFGLRTRCLTGVQLGRG